MFNSKQEFADFIRAHSKDETTYLTLLDVFSNIEVEEIRTDILSVIKNYIQLNEQLIDTANKRLDKIIDSDKFFKEQIKLTNNREIVINENLLLRQLYDFIKYEINKESIENNFLSGANAKQNNSEIKGKIEQKIFEEEEIILKYANEIKELIILKYDKGQSITGDFLDRLLFEYRSKSEILRKKTKKDFYRKIWKLLISDKEIAGIIIEKTGTKNVNLYIETILKKPGKY